jgi:uncharacterized protein
MKRRGGVIHRHSTFDPPTPQRHNPGTNEPAFVFRPAPTLRLTPGEIPIPSEESFIMTEAEKNAGSVRRGYEAFNKGDMKALTELFDESIVWHTPGRSSVAGEFKGRDATFAQFGRYGGGTAGTFRAALGHVFTSDDGRVIGVHHNTAERNGKRLDVWACLIFQFKNGKVIDAQEFFYDLYAWDTFWS